MPAAGVDRDPTEQRRGGLKGRDTCQEGGHFQRTTVRTYDTRVQSKIHSLANLAAARATCQPAAAARRSPTGPPRRAPHPRRMPGCTRGHGSAPPTAACPRAYAGGGPWWRISAFGLPDKEAVADVGMQCCFRSPRGPIVPQIWRPVTAQASPYEGS